MVVDEAEDGSEALQKIEKLHPDLIFMDIKLPGGNGLELTKKIKKAYSKIIIIILTNYDIPEYRQAAYRYGANHFVTKDSSIRDELLSLVESIVSDMDFEYKS
jgi:DNA-binding NarL/FixJ family response regulator